MAFNGKTRGIKSATYSYQKSQQIQERELLIKLGKVRGIKIKLPHPGEERISVKRFDKLFTEQIKRFIPNQ